MNVFMKFCPSDAFLLLTANVLVQIAVVVALAYAIAMVFARRRAAVRHAIWLSALGCVLLSPAAAYLAAKAEWPLLSLRLLPRSTTSDAEAVTTAAPVIADVRRSPESPFSECGDSSPLSVEPSESLYNATTRKKSGDQSPHSENTIRRMGSQLPSPVKSAASQLPACAPWRAMLGLNVMLWAAGAMILFVRLLHGCRHIARLRRRLQPIDGSRLAVLTDVRRALNTPKLPRLAMLPRTIELAGPITIGLFRPVVVVPEEILATLDSRGLRDVLVHEFAHAVRRDPLVGFVQRLAAIVYWPYPPVHFLNRRLAWAREEVCDNYVLRQGDAPSYAETLLAISQMFFSKHAQPAAPGLFHPYGRLEQRVAELLDPRRNVMVRMHRIALTVLAAMFSTAVIVVACTRLFQAEPPVAPAAPASPRAPAAPEGSELPGLPSEPAAPEGTLLPGLPPEQAAPAVGPNKPKPANKRRGGHKPTELYQTMPAKKQIETGFELLPPGRSADASLNVIQPLDVLTIRVVGTLPDQPINGVYLVEPDGRVLLGPVYRRADVKGLTMEQAESKIVQQLKEVLMNPTVQVTLATRGPRWREAVLPKSPFKIGVWDVLKVRVLGTLPDQPIDGFFLVEAEGTLALGPAYGRVQVKGLTPDAAEKAIQTKLQEVLQKPEVQVTWARSADQKEQWREIAPPKTPYAISPGALLSIRVVGTLVDQPIDGTFAVEPTGTVALGPAYGRVQVKGLTLAAAEEAIQKKLKEVLDKPEVQVTFGGWKNDAGSPLVGKGDEKPK